MIPFYSSNQGKALEDRVTAQEAKPESPLRKATGTIVQEDESVVVMFDIDDVDVFCSIVMENETKDWRICLTHGAYVATEPLKLLQGYVGADDGNTINVISVPEGDFYVNSDSHQSLFNPSVFEIFGVTAEVGDVITLTYYHTNCPCRMFE